MLVSVFTPSHHPAYLADCYASLKQQTAEDWEWVVAPNGPGAEAVAAAVRRAAAADRRVRLVPVPGHVPPGVGALKRFAADACKGDVLVELDHDDFLVPDCLERVAGEVAAGAGFVYSDHADFHPDGVNRPYAEGHGWEYYPVRVGAGEYLAVRAFPPTARSLCEVFYAPNHVRAWTRAAYAAAGGHDPRLAVGDDHDLVCRTYLAGVRFAHVPAPLYLQRCHPDQTSGPRHRNADIQAQSAATRDRFLHALVAEECRRSGRRMLDLGGAHDCPAGFTPVDRLLPAGAAGIRADVTAGLTDEAGEPLAPGSVGCVRAADFLEHLPPDRVVGVMNHLYDLLAPGGWLLSLTPAVSDAQGRVGRGAFQDPTHLSFWSENNFWYFTRRAQARYVPAVRCRFQAVRLGTGYPSRWHEVNWIPYVTADLCAVGAGRTPGPVDI